LTKGASGTFDFTGGVLDADVVAFDLVNQGGAIDPGVGSIGGMSILGDLTLSAGSFDFDVASNLLADVLAVDGTATLSGALQVSLLGGYMPPVGQSWQLLTASEILGSFDSVTPGFSVQQQGGSLWLFAGAGAGAGAVPEPHSLMLLLAAVVCLVSLRRPH
jgi:hypothetical protein